MRSIFTVLIGLALLTVAAPAVVSDSLAPVGATTNGDFERPFIPEVVPDALEGTPLDGCYGVGHQVLWGTESPQGVLIGTGPFSPTDAEPNPDGLVDRYGQEERPIDKARDDAADQVGPDTCVYGSEEGYDLAWLAPKLSTEKASGWSFHAPDPSVEFGYNLDDDPFDREVRFQTGGEGSTHNLWQAYNNRHQAFTGNFDHLGFTIEDGELDTTTGASVKVSLSATPSHEVDPAAAIEIDCVLTFDVADLAGNVEGDRVEMSPLDARFTAYRGDEACEPLVDAWDDESGDKRTLLGELRIVQLSFWRFNLADEPLVIDDIGLPGATLYAEEVTSGSA